MAASSFSSLVDMLKQPPSNNSDLMESLFSQPTTIPHDDFHVTEMFGELYFKESSSSTLNSLFPPSSPAPPPSSSPLPNPNLHTCNIEKVSDKTNLEKENSVKKQNVEENGCIYNKRSWENKERDFKIS
ncbi:hypothetical protein LOK49_LG07G01508 [Camellia lanceoleosa]|uniref:Uncharacterized protein n=1 Tax=Camellia lanceoleosa TaxID=1840588 RepID=A0ACC0GZ50_9ERIC|nr:hypothetical protein LOK49_LG07G01508 [Camellia lanceoleosa]